ncbi:MAG: Mov34/MPN/PAD-1 family protein [Candidatus Vogelbacteria bacterium]|nr:Mov34/MPN/PAD-1 family protein [Candidatus Vogelbacteria bacterium]
MSASERQFANLRRSPKIFITLEAKRKLELYIEYAEGEISGLGKAERIPGTGDLLITSIELFAQESDLSETDIDPKAITSMLEAIVEQGGSPEMYKVWWHSHVNGSAYFSSRDDETALFMGECGWMISLVGNKRHELRARLDVFEPMRLVVDGVEVVEWYDDRQLQIELKAEVAEKVRIKVRPPPPPQVYTETNSVTRDELVRTHSVGRFDDLDKEFQQLDMSDVDITTAEALKLAIVSTGARAGLEEDRRDVGHGSKRAKSESLLVRWSSAKETDGKDKKK